MKKISIILVIMSCSFIFATNGFASVVSADGVLALAGSYEVSLSPKVHAQYTVGPNASGGAQQWWSVGTYHAGGKNTYATAANITKLYKMENTETNQLSKVPVTVASESLWSDNGWKL